jgi:hypothetical protein
VLARPEDFTVRISQLGFGMWKLLLAWQCCLAMGDELLVEILPQNKQKKKERFMIWKPIASMCHLTLKDPCLFLGGGCFWTRLRASPQMCTLARWLWAHLQRLSA